MCYKSSFLFILFCLLYTSQKTIGQTTKPNIVLIVADDLGYSDISCFGGEIQTPQIDKLAKNGVRFNKFYVSPMCVTSRVAILSGMEYQAAGQNNFRKGISIAEPLRKQGYATSLVGKNHGMPSLKIGNPKTDFGFDHFYGFTGGQINSFTGKGNVKWQNDGNIFPNTKLPKDFYASNNFTDYALSYMKEAINNNKPFFTFVAYNAPHSPLDAPEKNVKKYYDPENGINVYQKGYDKMREERLKRMKKMGIVDKHVKLSEQGVEIPDWNLLPKTSKNSWDLQKDFEALSRSAYAGMVDNLDENIGRIVSFIEDPNQDGNTNDSQLDNTIIIFISDNGGCYAGSYTNRNALPWSQQNRGAGFTTNYGWATLSNTPFRYYKHASHEGAIRSPMVMHWPKGMQLKNNSINSEMLTLWDLYPTFLELADASYPKNKKKLPGKSFLPLLKGEKFESEEFFVSTFYRSKGIIKGNWKLVSYFDSPFELYNLKKDPTELINLADSCPKEHEKLMKAWDDYTYTHGFEDDKHWNTSPGKTTRGWGFDRMSKGLLKTMPEYMSHQVAIDQKLTLIFKSKISFENTKGKSIRLQKYGNPEIIWSKDLDENSSFQGKKEIVFDDFPVLEPNSHYYITWDSGWVKYFEKGKWNPLSAVRESAYAYRFKTGS
ncbi:sulfatase-like hydrolase/transferase [Flavicella sediminum]|uniref:sulfatase-like hydrolase/transferase n=1 Tax=Flavicella sediminum TaxID=2585141 RepID=UPI00111FD98A|nr:sulfatase-like hydrolase/transferase [Flavicella sediminum]